eukprot:2861554-Prorocentrum_lima.AAC.1
MCQEGAAEQVHSVLQEIYERAEHNGLAISWEMQDVKVGRQHALRDRDTANIVAHTLAMDDPRAQPAQ